MHFARLFTFVLCLVITSALAPAQTGGTAKAPAPKTDTKSASSKTAKPAASTKPDASSSAGLIDINRASEDELKTLPGIGDAYAAKIVKNRPYSNKSQLVSKKVLSGATYDKIKDKIIAKQ